MGPTFLILTYRMRKAVKVINLPAGTQRLFRRSLALHGASSQSQWLSAQIRRLILEAKLKFGEDLFAVLTPDEQCLMEVIRSGAAEMQQIIEESLLTEAKVRRVLDELLKRRLIEEKRKGGKTEGARGAVIKMYFVREAKP